MLCPKSVFAKDITEDIYINSENIFYDKTKETITLGEDSLIDYQGTIIGTNNALINNITKEITMKDKFYINSMDDIMKGDYYKGDLDFTMAESSNVNYLYQNDPIQIYYHLYNGM